MKYKCTTCSFKTNKKSLLSKHDAVVHKAQKIQSELEPELERSKRLTSNGWFWWVVAVLVAFIAAFLLYRGF